MGIRRAGYATVDMPDIRHSVRRGTSPYGASGLPYAKRLARNCFLGTLKDLKGQAYLAKIEHNALRQQAQGFLRDAATLLRVVLTRLDQEEGRYRACRAMNGWRRPIPSTAAPFNRHEWAMNTLLARALLLHPQELSASVYAIHKADQAGLGAIMSLPAKTAHFSYFRDFWWLPPRDGQITRNRVHPRDFQDLCSAVFFFGTTLLQWL